MFKGIQDRFKRKSAEKYLKNLNQGPEVLLERPKGINSVGCIVDLDRFDHPEAFYAFVEDFGLRPNAVRIIGFKSSYDKNSPYSTPIFSNKDLGWNGDIQNGYALEFLGKEYDLLVNYYDHDNLLLRLMSTKAKARIKVGLNAVKDDFNDLILTVPISDFKLFKSELRKYLRIFNEIGK